MLGAAKPAAPTHSRGWRPRRRLVGGVQKTAAAKAYFVEVMEAKRQAHHEDGEGAVVPPSVAGRSCRREGK